MAQEMLMSNLEDDTGRLGTAAKVPPKSEGGGGALTQQQWNDIISLFRAAVYDTSILPDPAAVIDDLENSTTASFTVTNTLTGCSTSNNAATIRAGESYAATLTLDPDYTFDSVTVAMGVADITSTAWDSTTKTITIASVTGNIEITAVATTHVLYALAQPYIASGQSDNYINTRLYLTETDRSFSIAGYIKFEDAFPNLTTNMQIMFLGETGDSSVFGYALYTSMYSLNGSVSVSPGTPANYNHRQNVKFVITHTAGADDRNIKLKYFDQDDAAATNRVCSGSGTKAFVSCENPIYIGKRDDGYGICNNLTVQTFKVLDYVMTADEIDAFIGTEEATV